MTVTPAAQQMNFVGGEWVPAADGNTREITNPANLEVLATVPESSEVDVEHTVAAAARAAEESRSWTVGENAEALLELARRLTKNAEEIAEIESRNVGKPIRAARAEVAPTIDHLRFLAGAARALPGQPAGEYVSGYTSMLRREPIGIAAQITPWNYPFQMAVWKIAPALATGNSVILKPSELTPLSALRMAELAADLFPPGRFNVITGSGEITGAALVRHRNVHMVSLTGDVSTGRAVAKAAAETLKHVHLELGGKAPVVLFDDADVVAATACLRSAGYLNAGQDCTAACRVIACAGVYDAILEELVPAVQSLRLGDPAADDAVELGPVISQQQRERVLGFVDRAAAGEAEVLTGGGAASGFGGFFVEPTIVANVNQDDEIVQREVFGPVVTVQRAADAAEAVRMANDVDYGLGASIWTESVSLAHRAAGELQFGTVWVNDHLPTAAEMPFGGYRSSGYGRDLSIESLLAYTQSKHVMIKLKETA